ncbi:MAG: 50S ribosomal protein L1 [Candidatus Peribacteraceae bacterium]|nr:50S ribosomal protein L1 [Candidatus Peribacteraceae bacterium]
MASKQSPLARKRGKKYAEKKALVPSKPSPIPEAVELLTKLSTANFDASAEVHIRILADTTQADQLVRTTVSLPHGTGKNVRVAAFVTDDKIDEAKKAGADLAGNEDLIKQITEGKIDFDITVAMPRLMKDLGKVAKILGQKGLMPSPKAGTVTDAIGKTVQELKKGRIECRMDKQGIIHSIFGKLSFGSKKLEENLNALIAAIKEAQPSGIKGEYIASVWIAPTMGPSVRVQL